MQVELLTPSDRSVDDFVDDRLLQVLDVETTFDLSDDLLASLVDDAIPVRSGRERRGNVSYRYQDDDRVLALGGGTVVERRLVKVPWWGHGAIE